MSMDTIAFGYYGGKFSHLKWVLPLLPVNGIVQYCEPFAGSGAVILNRPRVHIETYNDLDYEVVNFFRVLREQKDALIELLELTPFSRTEYLDALHTEQVLTDLERARRFYVRARQTMMALVQSATPGRWAYCVATEGGSAVERWLSGIPKLDIVAKRLREIQIECLPALECIARYDSENTLFYCDPPYVLDTRVSTSEYSNEMSDADHIQLSEAVHRCKGKVALSGYRSTLYDSLYADWFVTVADEKVSFASMRKDTFSYRQECLWTNYNPATVQNDMNGLPLFEGLA